MAHVKLLLELFPYYVGQFYFSNHLSNQYIDYYLFCFLIRTYRKTLALDDPARIATQSVAGGSAYIVL